MIKLIATDVDGTLVKDGTLLIDPEYMTVVSRLVDQGIYFVVCSGRQFSSEQKLFAPIKDRLLYISDGGTVVRTPEKILKTYPMETALWKSMCRMVHDKLPSCDCFAATPDYCLAEDAGSRMFHWLRDSYGFDVREVPDLSKVENEDIIKFTIYHPTSCEELCSPNFIPAWKHQAPRETPLRPGRRDGAKTRRGDGATRCGRGHGACCKITIRHGGQRG